MVLGRLRLRCLWDGQAEMDLDMRRKASNVELRATLTVVASAMSLSEVTQEWERRNGGAG